jgi:hypothetical protein
MCGARGASQFAAHSEDDLISETMIMAVRPVRRERSLFDTLQDEPDEEAEEEEEEDGETDTHLAVAERSKIETDAETGTVATAASIKEMKRKLRLPKELVRGFSLVKSKSIQSLRKLKGNKKVKEKSSKLQQYTVDQYSHYRDVR